MICCQDGCLMVSPKVHCQTSISVTILTSTAWRTLGLFGAFPTLWGGTIDPWACFLVVREIDCGNWLARGYMPAHHHCDLFYPLNRGSDWVYHKLSNAPVPQSGTGSWVLSDQSGARHPLSPVMRLGLRNPRKKERKCFECGGNPALHVSP